MNADLDTQQRFTLVYVLSLIFDYYAGRPVGLTAFEAATRSEA